MSIESAIAEIAPLNQDSATSEALGLSSATPLPASTSMVAAQRKPVRGPVTASLTRSGRGEAHQARVAAAPPEGAWNTRQPVLAATSSLSPSGNSFLILTA